MIPTKTLRERMREALMAAEDRLERGDMPDDWLDVFVQAAIDAIGDPVLIKTADSLEPTVTFRAQDLAADGALLHWYDLVRKHTSSVEKMQWAADHYEAFRAWPTRKWPD